MQTYEHYKDSGIDWIGQIPEHWELVPNKFIFNLKKNQVGKRSSEYDLLSLTLRGIIKRDIENPEGKFPAEFDTYQEVKVNDFVFCLFDVEETPRTVGLSNYDGMITGAYTVMEPIGENFAPFLYYYYLNADDKKQLKFLYRGLRNTIPKDSFFSLKTAIPPIHEQEAIANFLDEKTAKIDALVQTKEQQIEKLKELRQAKIHQAVTKGLDANAPTKDSGVEWIGEIPAHWELEKFKYLGFIFPGLSGKKGDDFNKENFEGAKEFVPFTTIFNFSQIKDERFQYVKISPNEIQNKVEKNDLLFLMSSETLNDIAKSSVYLLNKSSYLNSFCKGFRITSTKLNSIFTNYLLSSKNYRNYYELCGRGFTRINIKQEYINDTIIILPPIQEQEQIVAYLDEVTGKIDQAITQKQEQITQLKEYKQSLINNVVTGKVKVC